MTAPGTPEPPLFKRLRIAILLYILLFVALGQFLAARRSTDWNDTLWVDIHLVNGSGSESAERYIERLGRDAFAEVERFFAREAASYGVELRNPFRIRVAGELDARLPPLQDDAGLIGTVLWSLRMRWFVTRLHFSSDEPTPDITVFAVYEDGDFGGTLDRSTALRKGMIAVTNLFAKASARGSNQMIVAHELLHTLGASDKYDPATGLPLYPTGFAVPEQVPVYPQPKAELMAGRIPIAAAEAAIPRALGQVLIGPATAFEIGWIEAPPAD